MSPTTFLRTIIATLLVVSTLGTTPVLAEGDAGPVLKGAVEDFIRPGYTALHDEAKRMAELAQDLCEIPSPGTVQAAHEGFARLVEAWSRIEIVRFGPVVEQNRLERIHFFPDRRGLGLKQVQAALADQDETVTDAGRLAGKSVALQGLTALEYLLYGTGAETLSTGDPFRCAFAHAVATRISETTGELAAAWTDPLGIAQRFSEPAPANVDFRSAAESLQALLGVFVHSTELLADTRLAPFLGEDAAHARPKLAPYWRSGLTARAFAAALDGFRDLYAAAAPEHILAPAAARFGASAMFEMETARKAITGLSLPLDEAAADADGRGPATYLLVVLRSVRDTFSGRIAPGLGLSAGFSSLDGD
jgi:Predicted periplasmic lipoprotein